MFSQKDKSGLSPRKVKPDYIIWTTQCTCPGAMNTDHPATFFSVISELFSWVEPVLNNEEKKCLASASCEARSRDHSISLVEHFARPTVLLNPDN